MVMVDTSGFFTPSEKVGGARVLTPFSLYQIENFLRAQQHATLAASRNQIRQGIFLRRSKLEASCLPRAHRRSWATNRAVGNI